MFVILVHIVYSTLNSSEISQINLHLVLWQHLSQLLPRRIVKNGSYFGERMTPLSYGLCRFFFFAHTIRIAPFFLRFVPIIMVQHCDILRFLRS
jgi:hypothetical protein